MSIHKQHIKLIRSVNESKTIEEHKERLIYLNGWIDGITACGHALNIMECDNYYLEQGIDRPMCCGVWLDWSPSE